MATVKKRYRVGTHRACSPSATLKKYLPLAQAFGITRLADLTGLDDLGVPVVSAIRPMGLSLSTQQGKGVTLAAAQASALMESIETWHAEHVALPIVTGTARALAKSTDLIDVSGLSLARRFSLGRSLQWVEGWDFLSGKTRLVPLEAVTLDCTFAADHQASFELSSNGLASGNDRHEAAAHALCEIIERDAEATWREQGGNRRVLLGTIASVDNRRLIARLNAVGTRIAVWDLTSDVGVPVYGAMLMEDPSEPSWRGLGVYQGFGCHLDPEIAVTRAITEAVQTRLTYIAGSRDDFFPIDYQHASDPEAVAAAWELLTSPPDESIDLREAPRLATDTFEGDVAMLCHALAEAGAEQVVVVDLSRAEFAVPVVKVLVPGRANRTEWMG